MDTHQGPVTLKEILSKAPRNPVLWELFLTELAKNLACGSGVMLVTDLLNRENTHYLYLKNIPPTHQLLYEQKFNKLDLFNYFVAKNPYTVFCSQTLIESCFNDVVESEFMIPHGYQYRYGFSIPYNPRYSLCLYLQRSQPFTEFEQRQSESILQSLIPQLKKALRAEQWQCLYSQIVNLTGEHIPSYIIVDRTLKILFSDPIFSAAIAGSDCFQITGNQLDILHDEIKQRLISMMTEISCKTLSLANRHSSCGMMIIPAGMMDALYDWEFYKEGCILTFTNGIEKNPTIARLITLHDLTRCEAICALHFIANPSISDIADNTCRSVETVRNHIKKIMQKLDVHNQAALMKKLLALVSL